MAYVIVGDKVFDSKEIMDNIKMEFGFKDIRDLTSGSKRDDTLVYQIILDARVLINEIETDMDVEGMQEEELVEELMTSSDEHVILVEDIIPDEFMGFAYTYSYDKDMDEMKCLFVGVDENIGEVKLKEITERILKSID